MISVAEQKEIIMHALSRKVTLTADPVEKKAGWIQFSLALAFDHSAEDHTGSLWHSDNMVFTCCSRERLCLDFEELSRPRLIERVRSVSGLRYRSCESVLRALENVFRWGLKKTGRAAVEDIGLFTRAGPEMERVVLYRYSEIVCGAFVADRRLL